MGFTLAQARKALKETVGATFLTAVSSSVNLTLQDDNAERAVEWLFSHPDDTGEVDAPASSVPAQAHHPGGSATLPARYRLKAFISHKGPSVHSGHYVAHIKVDEVGSSKAAQWVLFNDEKVVKADVESVADLKKLAYLYMFERV